MRLGPLPSGQRHSWGKNAERLLQGGSWLQERDFRHYPNGLRKKWTSEPATGACDRYFSVWNSRPLCRPPSTAGARCLSFARPRFLPASPSSWGPSLPVIQDGDRAAVPQSRWEASLFMQILFYFSLSQKIMFWKFRSWKCENIHTKSNHKLWNMHCIPILFCLFFCILLLFSFSVFTLPCCCLAQHMKLFIISKRAFKKTLAWWACKFSVLKFYYLNNILWLTDTRIKKRQYKKEWNGVWHIKL